MAKNKKKQREERLVAQAKAKALEAEKKAVEVPVEPPKPEPELPKVKPPKKRYVRPPRQVRAATPTVLSRGTSYAARVMSSSAAKNFIEPESKLSKEEDAPTKQISGNDTGPQGLIAGHFQSGRRQAARRDSEG